MRNLSAGSLDLPRGARIEPDSELVIHLKPPEPDMPLAFVALVAEATLPRDGEWLVRCECLSRATEADLVERGPTQPPHRYAQARRVLRACYGLDSPKNAAFSY